MAKPTKKYLLLLAAQHGPEIAKAFKQSIASIKNTAQIGALTTMLEKGDLDVAMLAIGLDPSAFRKLDQSIVDTYEDGGGKTAQSIPAQKTPDGLRMVVQFNVRNERAESWLRAQSSTLIREIIEDQRQVIRQVLADGLARGENPKTIARQLVGVIDPATGLRKGGVLGLTAHQQTYVANYLDELLSGDPARMRNALGRARRDPKFDAALRRAIAAGEPLDAALARKAADRYQDRLLVLRAETIGRTEAMTALHQSQEEAYQQAIDTGAIQSNHLRYFWRTAADERVRHSHAQIPKMNEKGVPHGQPFSSPLGPIRFPGDPKASTANRVGCRCWREAKVDFLAQAVEAEKTPKPALKPKKPKQTLSFPERVGPDGRLWSGNPKVLADQVADNLMGPGGFWTDDVKRLLDEAPTAYRKLSLGQAGLINWYTGSGYDRLNADLRNGTGNWFTPIIRDALNGALLAVGETYKGVVSRGLTLSSLELERYRVGGVVEFPAFTSTGRGFKFSGNVEMWIHSLSGVDINPLSQFKDLEKEVLIPAGATFKVLGMSKKGTTTVIELQELPAQQKATGITTGVISDEVMRLSQQRAEWLATGEPMTEAQRHMSDKMQSGGAGRRIR